MNLGTVFIWEDFPHPRTGAPKNNWFVLLGSTGALADIPIFYLHRFTSQTQYYQEGEVRAHHNYLLFPQDTYPFLEEDSVLDFHEPPYAETQEFFQRYESSFDERGTFQEGTLREIYKRVLRSPAYEYAVKFDIHRSLNDKGIIGLQAPIRRRSRRRKF